MPQVRPLRISVALATYNGERFLPQQLESLCQQTRFPDEIVISDDASTDRTLHILQQFAKQFPSSVQLHYNHINIGFIKNFEQTIGKCTGDIIALCDQDDVWLPQKLEKMLAIFQKLPDCGLVIGDGTVVDAQLNSLGSTIYSRQIIPTETDTVRSLIRKTDIKGCTMAFRSQFLPYLLPIETQVWGHDHWISFILGVISKVHKLDEALMLYRRHSHNSGNTPYLDGRFATFRAMFYNLSFVNYKTDYQRWLDILHHLNKLTSHPAVRDSILNALPQVTERLNFAQNRLDIRQKHHSVRLKPIKKLWQTGAYHQFAQGWRTALKDIIAR